MILLKYSSGNICSSSSIFFNENSPNKCPHCLETSLKTINLYSNNRLVKIEIFCSFNSFEADSGIKILISKGRLDRLILMISLTFTESGFFSLTI